MFQSLAMLSVGKDLSDWSSHIMLVGVLTGATSLGNVLPPPNKLNMNIPYNPATSRCISKIKPCICT